ncbi:hypothetical protein CEXT_176781 [Caerostris extrusa]|uniref:Uncharacterized protein n=1 Tax=Caerostris extrusa TaxID=172846 RepID=A0AAV4MRL8_CAEEX|nr:hypothetical protein CEXT_176781 [Caerostris extrusa]
MLASGETSCVASDFRCGTPPHTIALAVYMELTDITEKSRSILQKNVSAKSLKASIQLPHFIFHVLRAIIFHEHNARSHIMFNNASSIPACIFALDCWLFPSVSFEHFRSMPVTVSECVESAWNGIH